MKTLIFVLTMAINVTAFAADGIVKGIPTIDCFNNNFRELKLRSNGKNQLELVDSYVGVPKGLDVLEELIGKGVKVGGFRYRGDLAQSCSHVAALPAVFSCRFQGPLEVLDEAGKVILNVQYGDFSIGTQLSSRDPNSLPLQVAVSATVLPDAKHKEHRYIQFTLMNPWIQLGHESNNAGCDIR